MNQLKQTKRRGQPNQPQKNLNQSFSFYITLILCFTVGTIPLALYFKRVVFNDPGHLFMDGLGSHLDIFSYYKMVLLLLFSAVGIILFFCAKEENVMEKQKQKFYILMGIFLFMVFISTIFSEYKQVAIWGFWNRYEGVFVLLAYMVILFLAMNIFKEERLIRLLFCFLLGSAFILTTIGVFQLFGVNFFRSNLFIDIITPAYLEGRVSDIKSNFPNNTVSSTLINSNYMGSYTAILLPVSLIFFIHARKVLHKALLGIPLLLIIMNWIGCESRAGIIGGVLSLLVIAVMFRKKIFEKKLFVIVALIFLCMSFIVINVATKGLFINKVTGMLTLQGRSNINSNPMEKVLEGLKDVKINSKQASFSTVNGIINISLPDGELRIKDENNNDISIAVDGNRVNFRDKRFSNTWLNTNPDAGLIEVYYNDFKLINILLTENGLNSNSNIWMVNRDDKEIGTLGLVGMESYGSNRGYIWNRTIPLLKSTLLIGHGPDTFPLYFPQYDYIGKLKNYQTGGIFVDKPHNLYLQTAVNTGVLSLVALLILFGIYFILSIRIYWKQDLKGFLSISGLACFASFCGYMAAGFFNDSVVAVAPIFWVLLGTGISINITMGKNCNQRNKKTVK